MNGFKNKHDMTNMDNPQSRADLKELLECEKFALKWTKSAGDALMTLWRQNSGFIRSTAPNDSEDAFYPTAFYHGVIALAETGVFIKADEGKRNQDAEISTPDFSLSKSDPNKRIRPKMGDVSANSLLLKIVTPKTNGRTNSTTIINSPQELVNWHLEQSSHTKGKRQFPSRDLIPFAPMLLTISTLISSSDDEVAETIKKTETYIIALIDCASLALTDLFEKHKELEPNFPTTAASLLNASYSVTSLKSILIGHPQLSSKFLDIKLAEWKKTLVVWLEQQIDYHLARDHESFDASYDPVSLICAIRALLLLIRTKYFLEPQLIRGLKSVANAQLSSGCWPTGVSISYVSTGDVVQQPSVSVALLLAESLLRPFSLIEHSQQQLELFKAVVPSLRKMAKYLTNTKSALTKNTMVGLVIERAIKIPARHGLQPWFIVSFIGFGFARKF